MPSGGRKQAAWGRHAHHGDGLPAREAVVQHPAVHPRLIGHHSGDAVSGAEARPPTEVPGMKRHAALTLGTVRSCAPVVLAALAALVGCGKEEAPPPPPPAVKVAAVLQKDVPIHIEAIGQTRGSTEIEVRARVEGFLQGVHFKEGFPVKKGQLLYTIDPQPFEATLAQAKGSLAEAEANLARAHQDVVRYEPLVQKNAISRQEYETAVAIERAAVAAVEAAKAVADRARIDLGYTRVLAPEDGLVGKTEVYPGTLVGRGQSDLLTRISQTGPSTSASRSPSATTCATRDGPRSGWPPAGKRSVRPCPWS
jgi:multidrug efflux pump subunit AcrA (membrane-fusion protein)